MKKRPFFKKTLFWLPVSLISILSIIVCYLAYVYVPPEDRTFESPYLESIDSGFIHTDEFKIHYTLAGQGDPVILIHGSCAWMYSFRKNIPALAKKFCVYALFG